MKFKYDWSKYPEVNTFLMQIYSNTKVSNNDDAFAKEIICDIEEFLNYFQKNNYDISIIISKLKNIQYIGKLSSGFASDNGITYLFNEPVIAKDNAIYLSRKFASDNNLSARNRQKLYLYKGLIQNIFSFNNEFTLEFSKLYSELFNNSQDTELLVNAGWKLLNEVLTQELAERITYSELGQDRPTKTVGITPTDYYPINGNLVASRLELYRPFEEMTIHFGEAISGVGSLLDQSEETIMNDLICKVTKGNFSEQVISEYIYNNNELELYLILYSMGLLLNEKYAMYGKRIVPSINLNISEINSIYNNLIERLNRLYTLDSDEYTDVSLKEVNKNIFVKKRIKEEIPINL